MDWDLALIGESINFYLDPVMNQLFLWSAFFLEISCVEELSSQNQRWFFIIFHYH